MTEIEMEMALGPLGEGSSGHLSQFHLAHLSAARHWDGAGDSLFSEHKHMLRRLVSAQGLPCPGSEVVIGRSVLARCNLNEGAHHFSVLLICDTDDRGQLNIRVRGESLFDLEGVDIFASYGDIKLAWVARGGKEMDINNAPRKRSVDYMEVLKAITA